MFYEIYFTWVLGGIINSSTTTKVNNDCNASAIKVLTPKTNPQLSGLICRAISKLKLFRNVLGHIINKLNPEPDVEIFSGFEIDVLPCNSYEHLKKRSV